MVYQIASPGSGLIALTLLFFAGSAGAQEVSPRCEAAIDRAAGGYSQCLLRADAQHARDGKARKLERRQARCETRFDRRTTRAIGQHEAGECASALLVTAIADRTVSCAEGVAMEAGGQAATSRMYVQIADRGTLTESTLTLTGPSRQTGWFTGRPYRDAGRMPTAEFVALFFEEGANSFAANPPNADLACESGGSAVSQVVTLTEPVFDEATDTLTYTAALVASAGDEDSFAGITCDAGANLFIDSTIGAASTCTPTAAYDCFVGGFCAEAAMLYPPAQSGYTNLYTDDTSDTGDALLAGCSTSPGDLLFTYGAGIVSVVNSEAVIAELELICSVR